MGRAAVRGRPPRPPACAGCRRAAPDTAGGRSSRPGARRAPASPPDSPVQSGRTPRRGSSAVRSRGCGRAGPGSASATAGSPSDGVDTRDVLGRRRCARGGFGRLQERDGPESDRGERRAQAGGRREARAGGYGGGRSATAAPPHQRKWARWAQRRGNPADSCGGGPRRDGRVGANGGDVAAHPIQGTQRAGGSGSARMLRTRAAASSSRRPACRSASRSTVSGGSDL